MADSAASAKLSRSRKEVTLGRLELIAARIAGERRFSDGERDTLKGLLLDVRAEPEIAASPDFANAASSVINTLYGANLDADIDDLDTQLSDFFEKTVI